MNNDDSNSSQNFSILEFNDYKIKALAQSLQNGTAQKIIELMQDGTLRSQQMISKELVISKATIFHAVKLLLESEILKINKKELSLKHKEICYYSLNHKPIVICPKKKNLINEIKMPLLTVIGFVSIFILNMYYKTNNIFSSQLNSRMSNNEIIQYNEISAATESSISYDLGINISENQVKEQTIIDILLQFDITIIVILSCILMSLVYLLYKIIKNYKN